MGIGVSEVALHGRLDVSPGQPVAQLRPLEAEEFRQVFHQATRVRGGARRAAPGGVAAGGVVRPEVVIQPGDQRLGDDGPPGSVSEAAPSVDT